VNEVSSSSRSLSGAVNAVGDRMNAIARRINLTWRTLNADAALYESRPEDSECDAPVG
jgi:hypothetical protein